MIDAADLLTTVFAMLGFSARAAGVRLILDTPRRGVRLLGDRELLLDGLVTLATDAIEATAPGGLVTLASRPGGEREIVVEITRQRGLCRDTHRLTLPTAPAEPERTVEARLSDRAAPAAAP